MKHALILTLILTACGTSAEEQAALIESAKGSTDTPIATSEVATVDPGAQAKSSEKETVRKSTLFFTSSKELPFCDESLDGTLAYIDSSDEFYACSNLGWKVVDIQGKDGAAGVNGVDGSDGLAGINGVNGSNGVDGTDAINFEAISNNGSHIGTYVGMDAGNNRMDILTDSGLRVTLDQTSGTLRSYAYPLMFSGSNCTGTVRSPALLGYFQNVIQDPRDLKFYKQVGASLGAFNYVSRIQSGVCMNTAGSITQSFAVEYVADLGFVYPAVGGVSIKN